MMRSIQRMIAALVFVMIIAVSGTASRAEGSKGILYRAQNGSVTVYLLGSIHVGNQEMYPFGEAIQEAMENSDTFVFECDTSSKDAVSVAVEMMHYQDGTALADVIPETMYRKLEDACKKIKVRMKTFENMRPWAVMTQLSMHVTAAEMGVKDVKKSVALGVENMVYEFAKKNKKTLGYLETTKGQMEAFEGMSLALQEYLLDEALTVILHPEMVQGMDATIRDWPVWWREGSISAFVKSYEANYLTESGDEAKTAILQEYHSKMLTKRNLTMTDMVEQYLQEEEPHTYFVTVGLLHLVLADDSIVKYLRDRGYDVEGISVP